jgi:hypothetical protein
VGSPANRFSGYNGPWWFVFVEPDAVPVEQQRELNQERDLGRK